MVLGSGSGVPQGGGGGMAAGAAERRPARQSGARCAHLSAGSGPFRPTTRPLRSSIAAACGLEAGLGRRKGLPEFVRVVLGSSLFQTTNQINNIPFLRPGVFRGRCAFPPAQASAPRRQRSCREPAAACKRLLRLRMLSKRCNNVPGASNDDASQMTAPQHDVAGIDLQCTMRSSCCCGAAP
jgi:hypothetical protein